MLDLNTFFMKDLYIYLFKFPHFLRKHKKDIVDNKNRSYIFIHRFNKSA